MTWPIFPTSVATTKPHIWKDARHGVWSCYHPPHGWDIDTAERHDFQCWEHLRDYYAGHLYRHVPYTPPSGLRD